LVIGGNGVGATVTGGFNLGGGIVYCPSGPTTGRSLHLNLWFISIPINYNDQFGSVQGNYCFGFSGVGLQPSFTTDPSDTVITVLANAFDPNDKRGPIGFGTPNFVEAGKLLSYRIDFENAKTATAPAHMVTITDQLASTLDWRTFKAIASKGRGNCWRRG